MFDHGDTINFTVEQLKTQVGRVVQGDAPKIVADKNKGFCSYGPNVHLPTGKYVAVINYSASDHLTGWCDVYFNHNKSVLLKKPFKQGQNEQIELEFEVTAGLYSFPCEVRSYFSGIGRLEIHFLAIKRISGLHSMGITASELSNIKPLKTDDPLLTSYDKKRLLSLHNKYCGKRIFIIGNGPSLNKMPLELLKNEYTFGVNRIYLLFDRIDWRPTFYAAFDLRVVPDNADEINALDLPYKFFATKHIGTINNKSNHFWYQDNSRRDGLDNRFEPSAIVTGFGGGGSITHLAIQIAYFMGFDPIYLIGVDADYKIIETVKQSGEDKFGDGILLNLESTKDDDVNHFDPRYFGKGKKWHNPNVPMMLEGFKDCRKAIEGRRRSIYNATAGGKLDLIKRVQFEELFKNNNRKYEKHLTIGIDLTSDLAHLKTGMSNVIHGYLEGFKHGVGDFNIKLFVTNKNVGDFAKYITDKINIVETNKENLSSFFYDIDLVHFPFNSYPVTHTEIPAITTICDLIPEHYPNSFPLSVREQLRSAASKSNSVITISNYVAQDVIANYHCDPAKVQTVYCALRDNMLKLNDQEIEIKVKNKYRLPDNYILYPAAGRFHKNHDTLFRALKEIDSSISLVLTTGETHASERMQKLLEKAKEVGVDDRTLVLGHVDELDFPHLYDLARLVVIPSLDEGFCLPAVEAMARRCPVISSNKTALPEVCSDAAFFVEPTSVDDIVKAIKRVNLDQGLRNELIQKGFLNAQRFTPEKIANSLLDVYEKTINSTLLENKKMSLNNIEEPVANDKHIVIKENIDDSTFLESSGIGTKLKMSEMLIGTGWSEVEKEGEVYIRWMTSSKKATVHLNLSRNYENRLNLIIHDVESEAAINNLKLFADDLALTYYLSHQIKPYYLSAIIPADHSKPKGERTVVTFSINNERSVLNQLDSNKSGLSLREINAFPLYRPLFYVDK